MPLKWMVLVVLDSNAFGLLRGIFRMISTTQRIMDLTVGCGSNRGLREPQPPMTRPKKSFVFSRLEFHSDKLRLNLTRILKSRQSFSSSDFWKWNAHET